MNRKIQIIFAGVMGILYLCFGIVQVATVVPVLAELAALIAVPADPLGGYVLCVIGLVFLTGVVALRSGEGTAVAYLFVGALLSLGFGLVALLTIGAGWLETVLFGEPGEWSAGAVAVPMLYLAVGSLAGFRAWGRQFLRGVTRA